MDTTHVDSTSEKVADPEIKTLAPARAGQRMVRWSARFVGHPRPRALDRVDRCNSG